MKSVSSNRQSLLDNLAKNLSQTAHCCSISGPGNIGKSFFLRQLEATSSLTSANSVLFVFIDGNLRADNSPQAFYELVLRSISPKLNPQIVIPENLASFSELYKELCHTSDTFNQARCFLAAFDIILAKRTLKLVLLFDEFDYFLETLPDLIFLQLRGLKDNFSEQLNYVVATRWPLLAMGREDEEGVSEFYELFDAAHQLFLQPLTEDENDELACQYTQTESQEQLAEVYQRAGGHPMLTKLIARQLLEKNDNASRFNNDAGLSREERHQCERIWTSLHASEQKALLQELDGIRTLANDSLLGSLRERGLLKTDASGNTRIFAEIFELFVREKLQTEIIVQPSLLPTELNSNVQAIAFDMRREEVIFNNGAKRVLLNGNAATLFKYLFVRQSEPCCTKDELITAIWGYDGYSTENLDKLVSDLRQIIDDHDKRIIRTIPRKGLQMVGVKAWSN